MKNTLTKEIRNKGGFTLIELMVYIALMGVIVVVAGQVFSDSSKFRVRSEGMIRTNAITSDVASFMLEDVGQTGAKSVKEVSTSGDVFAVKDSLYMDPSNTTEASKDSSSYKISKSCASCDTDTLTVRRIHYGASGEFKSVEEVRWFKVGKKLYRSCRTLPNTSSTADDDCGVESDPKNAVAVEIADNIDSFKVVPAKPRVVSNASSVYSELSQILPSSDASVTSFRLVPRYGDENFYFLNVEPVNGSDIVELSSFASNYDFENNVPDEHGKKANQVFVAPANGSGGTSASWTTLCKKVTLEPQTEYEISFSVPFYANESRMFCPGRDYAAVGFRNQQGKMFTGLDDFNFYLPASNTETPQRTFRFTVKNKVENACMAFTFASYSPVVASGKVTLQNVSLKKVETSNFNFEDEDFIPYIVDKKNVKALLVKVVAKRNGESSKIRQVIPVPSNGPRD